MQGARIGEGCHIDTLDVCDFELVTLGDNVVLNEGSSITGHYFQDGCLHLEGGDALDRRSHLTSYHHGLLVAHCHSAACLALWHCQGSALGSPSQLQWEGARRLAGLAGMTCRWSWAAGPGWSRLRWQRQEDKLAAGASMAPQSTEAVNAAAAKKRGAKPAPVLGALGTQLHSRALTALRDRLHAGDGQPLCRSELDCRHLLDCRRVHAPSILPECWLTLGH